MNLPLASCRRLCAFAGLFSLAGPLCVPAQQPPADFRAWEEKDFRSRGHLENGEKGEQSEQLKFWRWPGDNTLLDLRGGIYLAHENGPVSEDSVPAPRASLAGLRETASAEKYPISIKGGGSKNILVRGGRVIGVQPRALTWRNDEGSVRR